MTGNKNSWMLRTREAVGTVAFIGHFCVWSLSFLGIFVNNQISWRLHFIFVNVIECTFIWVCKCRNCGVAVKCLIQTCPSAFQSTFRSFFFLINSLPHMWFDMCSMFLWRPNRFFHNTKTVTFCYLTPCSIMLFYQYVSNRLLNIVQTPFLSFC